MATDAIQCVIVDFGGVLTRSAQRNRLFRRCEDEFGWPRGHLLNVLFSGEHWWAVSTGRLTAEAYWNTVRALLGGHIPLVLEPLKFNPFAFEELNQSMATLVRKLHRRHRTILLSNATPYLDVLVAQHGLVDAFDLVINSSSVGMRKPEPALFRLALEHAAARPEACLFVDDKQRNVDIAAAMGMQVIVFRSVADLERRIEGLAEGPTRVL